MQFNFLDYERLQILFELPPEQVLPDSWLRRIGKQLEELDIRAGSEKVSKIKELLAQIEQIESGLSQEFLDSRSAYKSIAIEGEYRLERFPDNLIKGLNRQKEELKRLIALELNIKINYLKGRIIR